MNIMFRTADYFTISERLQTQSCFVFLLQPIPKTHEVIYEIPHNTKP